MWTGEAEKRCFAMIKIALVYGSVMLQVGLGFHPCQHCTTDMYGQQTIKLLQKRRGGLSNAY